LPSLGEGSFRPLRDQTAFFLGKRRIEVEHEGIGIGAKLCHNERHLLRHQAGDEGDVARGPVELGDDHRAALSSGCGQCLGEARAPVEGVRSLTGLDLDELADEVEAFGLGEALEGGYDVAA